MKLISRTAAKAAGLKRYFTGEPCVRGHIAERQVTSYQCVVCAKAPPVRARTPEPEVEPMVEPAEPAKRGRGRPRNDGTPARARIRVEEVAPPPSGNSILADANRESAIASLTRHRKQIDIPNLLLSGRYMHTDGEAAAFQRMSAASFSKWMKRRDPVSKLTYREIFTDARSSGRATLLRRMIELGLQDSPEFKDRTNPAAAVTAMKFIMANEFGWSEKRVDEQRGSVTHRHTHEVIPHDDELRKMSDTDLADLMAQAGGAGKPVTRH